MDASGGFDSAIVHYPCPDGEAAKIILRDKFGAQFPVKHYTHGMITVDESWAAQFKGQRLLCVDWCPSSVQGVLFLAKAAKELTIIDHHQSALAIVNDEKSLPQNVRLIVQSPKPAASTALFHFLYAARGEEKNKQTEEGVPEWLRIIDLHDTGQPMTADEQAVHAGLTDDLDNLDEQRQKPVKELLERGKFLVEKYRPMVAQSIISKAEMRALNVQGGGRLGIAYVDVPHEKFIHETNKSFWNSPYAHRVDILAIRFSLLNSRTDFKLRRPPSSQFDLASFAQEFAKTIPGASGGGHAAAAGLQLPNSPKFIPDQQ